MARKRTDLGARAEKMIAELGAGGASAAVIAKALQTAGIKRTSEATIKRRLLELRGPVRAARGTAAAEKDALREEYSKAAAAEPEPESTAEDLPKGDAIPADASLDQIERWIRRADTMGKAAFARGDLEGMGKMGRLSAALMEAKRKATPDAKEDPNDSPDMRKLGEEVEARFLKYIDDVLGAAT